MSDQEPKKDAIGDALRRVPEREKVNVDDLPTEGEQFGQGPTTVGGSAFSMMQNMQNRLGDEYPEDEKPPRCLGPSLPKMELPLEAHDPPKKSTTPQPPQRDRSKEEILTSEDAKPMPPLRDPFTGIPMGVTPDGLREVRMSYAEWLEKHNISAEETSTNTAPMNIREMTSQEIEDRMSRSASNTTSQPAISACIRESASSRNLKNLIEFVRGGQPFCPDWVRQRLCGMELNSPLMPISTQWKMPVKDDLADLIYKKITSEGYVENRFPSLEIVMGDSIDNHEWCAAVLCLFGMIDVLVFLGQFKKSLGA